MHQHAHRGAISWDGLGAGISFACAIHCALLPLAFTLIPSLNLALRSFNHEWHGLAQWLLWTHSAEQVMASIVAAFASVVLGAGFLKHRQWTAPVIALVGMLLLLGGAFGPWHANAWLHVSMQVGGGVLIACAHVVNLRCLNLVPQRSAPHQAQATGTAQLGSA